MARYNLSRTGSSLKLQWHIVMRPPGISRSHYKSTTWTPLETAEGGTCQDTERNRPTDAHSPTGDVRGRHLSGHRKEQTDRRALTSWRQQREALVRTPKETDRPTRTHFLQTAEVGTCQDTERNRSTDAHSQTGDSRERHLSGHQKKQTDQRALTNWRWQREALVRTLEETD